MTEFHTLLAIRELLLEAEAILASGPRLARRIRDPVRGIPRFRHEQPDPAVSEREFWGHVGQRVAELRNGLGVSQAEIARRVGYASPSIVSMLETGRQQVPAFVLFCIAGELGVEVGELFPATRKQEDAAEGGEG